MNPQELMHFNNYVNVFGFKCNEFIAEMQIAARLE